MTIIKPLISPTQYNTNLYIFIVNLCKHSHTCTTIGPRTILPVPTTTHREPSEQASEETEEDLPGKDNS